MVLILLKYLFYFAILGVVVYMFKTLFAKNDPVPPSPPPKKLTDHDHDFWLEPEERMEQRVKKYKDNDFV